MLEEEKGKRKGEEGEEGGGGEVSAVGKRRATVWAGREFWYEFVNIKEEHFRLYSKLFSLGFFLHLKFLWILSNIYE